MQSRLRNKILIYANGIILHFKGSDGGHNLKVQNFYSLQWCDKCEKCLWGLYDQGLQCTGTVIFYSQFINTI